MRISLSSLGSRIVRIIFNRANVDWKSYSFLEVVSFRMIVTILNGKIEMRSMRNQDFAYLRAERCDIEEQGASEGER